MGSSSIFAGLARRLEGKVALITGGSSGIGECTARLFSRHGAKVVIADVQDELGHAVCDSIGQSSASFVHCNVTDESDVRNAVDCAVAKHGRLDIMHNNAGIREMARPIVDTDVSDFEKVLRVHVVGTFLGTKHAARVMIPAGCGSIISTASVASVIAGTSTHGYTCSKHAVVGLTKNAAVELGLFGIRVNCVSPFIVATPMSTMEGLEAETMERGFARYANLKGAVLKAEDVAVAALYLASDESQYVSGHNLMVDGGFSIVNPVLMSLAPKDFDLGDEYEAHRPFPSHAGPN